MSAPIKPNIPTAAATGAFTATAAIAFAILAYLFWNPTGTFEPHWWPQGVLWPADHPNATVRGIATTVSAVSMAAVTALTLAQFKYPASAGLHNLAIIALIPPAAGPQALMALGTI